MPAEWNGDKVSKEVEKMLGLGLDAGARFLANKVREKISVPAPRARTKSKHGVIYYRARTKATAGAPPRKLSGALRRSITSEVNADGTVARVGSNIRYARRLEKGGHAYLEPALMENQAALAAIIGEAGRGA